MYDMQVSVLVWRNWKTPIQGIYASRRSAVEASASHKSRSMVEIFPRDGGFSRREKSVRPITCNLVSPSNSKSFPRMSRPIVFAPLRGACSLTDKARRPSRHQPRWTPYLFIKTLACHTSSLKAYHRFGLAKQTSMTFPHIRAVKPSGETFALDGNLQVATTSLEKDGCLLLKGATDLRPIEPSMEARYSRKGFEKTSEDDGSLDIRSTLDSVARDVYLNRVSGYAALQIFLTAVTRSLALYCSPPVTNTSSPLTTPSYTSIKSDSG